MLLEPIKWNGREIVFIDQTKLPSKLRYIRCREIETLCRAIKGLKIRGAPLIGVAVALGYALSAVNSKSKTPKALKRDLGKASYKLGSTRPTAVNLFWALKRMEGKFEELSQKYNRDIARIKRSLCEEAMNILRQDREMCYAIGKNGASLIKNGDVILTYCNAGMLATAGWGTALSILYKAKKERKRFKVFIAETRPLMQGSRLTMWELLRNGIDATLICDNMAAVTIREKEVTKIITGADRIARNGDTANKIGTYALAVLGRYHHIPFYIAAPSSTIDMSIKTGRHIPIEERDPEELIYTCSRQTAPLRSKVYNPAFDITPARLITGIITESGIYDIKTFKSRLLHEIKRYRRI